MSLQQVLAVSDVVIGAVPVAEYKIKTAWLKDGCVAVNVAQEKNFEADVREKVRACLLLVPVFSCWVLLI
jgi:methylenetetrahydrofolate dehydrogenase (NAD+)